MSRRRAIGGVGLAAIAAVAASLAPATLDGAGSVAGVSVAVLAGKALSVLAVLAFAWGVHAGILSILEGGGMTRRRRAEVGATLRAGLALAALLAVLGVLTEQWLGALVSVGVAGVVATVALQQPLVSLVGWVYVMTKQPYRVGDRIQVGQTKGDVMAVDTLVTTLWEVGGDLVTSNQPSGRVVTVPNSAVLDEPVVNFTAKGFPHVWNEVAIQVAYETDLAFASETAREVVDDYLGDEMVRTVERYRDALAETPVELELQDRPSVNLRQGESWVELRVRYLVHPRRGQRVRNELYRQLLRAFNEHPERVKFPVGRNR